MLKKILLATALVATASFATWDKFPVKEAGKGQAKVGLDYQMQGEASGMELVAGARFSPIANLEIGTVFSYVLFTDYDGIDGPDGVENLPIMIRYQFMPTMNAFLDVDLPIGEEELSSDGLGLHFGVQYSQGFGMVTLGSELGLEIRTEGDDEVSPPYVLNVGAEGDFAVNEMITPYVGADLYMLLGEKTHDGEELPGSDYSGTIGVHPYVGVGIAFNPMFTLDLFAGFGIGEDYYGEDTLIDIAATLFINF